MASDVLAPATHMGPVTLTVADLDALTAYYRDGVGLDVQHAAGDRVVLGRGGHASLVLQHTPALRHASASAAGLYHTALVFDSQTELAQAVLSVARRYPRSFTGSSDHAVSEAFYFDDPEGNGVELYWDRPRSTWTWSNAGVGMTTTFLDPNRYLREHLVETTPRGATSVGHVHLRVGDIPTAHAFYVDTLGFEVTANLGTALFVSAGRYHHHIGMNTWQSNGAGPRTPALGLGQVVIRVPDADALGALRERLTDHGVALRDDGRTLSFDDPWKNAVRAALADAAPADAGAGRMSVAGRP